MPVHKKNHEAAVYSQKGDTVQVAVLQQGEFNAMYAALSLLAAQITFIALFSTLPDNTGYNTQATSTHNVKEKENKHKEKP